MGAARLKEFDEYYVFVCKHNKTPKDRHFSPRTPGHADQGYGQREEGLGKNNKMREYRTRALTKGQRNVCTKLPTPLNLPRRRVRVVAENLTDRFFYILQVLARKCAVTSVPIYLRP